MPGSLTRRALPAAAAFLLSSAGALAAEVFVAGPRLDLLRLKPIAAQWEADSGHQVVWLADDGDAADLVVAGLAEARALAREGLTGNIALPEEEGRWVPPPLARGTLDSGGSLIALPVRIPLPTLRGNSEVLARSGAGLPAEPSWQEVLDIAGQAVDPVGNVHGLCVTGQAHAAVVRSFMADAGLMWLDGESGGPYAGAGWREQSLRYARAMAQSGPPNASHLTAAESAGLLSRGKCAMWLARPGDPVSSGEQVAAVPGATAFAVESMTVIGVAAGTDRRSLATSLAWWLSEMSLEEQAAEGAPWAASAWEQPGSSEVVTGPDSVPLDWKAVDQAGEDSLRRLVDGLLPAGEALGEAAAALAD